MILGSHNSWSYLPCRKWWMKLISFTARCQEVNIASQYLNYNTRCFDLRIRFDKNNKLIVAHGIIEYNISEEELMNCLSMIDKTKDSSVRIIHEARNKEQYTENSIKLFKEFCEKISNKFKNTKFWCGKNLYDWTEDYKFDYNPSCEEIYASVCPPNLIDDWYPKWFAKKHNDEVLDKGTDKDILLIDFVNIGQ